LPHPAASTMQSTKSAPQSAERTHVNSFFPVFILFPMFQNMITAEFCTDANAANGR